MVNLRTEIVSALIQIIDLAASKGVFSGNDLTTVGTIRSELVQTLKENMPKEEKMPAAETVELEPSEK